MKLHKGVLWTKSFDPAYRAVLLLITTISSDAWQLIYAVSFNLNGINLLPTINAAPIKTKFFTMYWPSKVRPKGKLVKQTSGNKMRGKNVPGICSANKKRPTRIKGLYSMHNPIATSQYPRIGMNIFGLIQ